MQNNILEQNLTSLTQQFGNRFVTIKGENHKKIKWPQGFGVYLIWSRVGNSSRQLIYIGMTGKFVRKSNSISVNNGAFSKRKARWTPYFFDETLKNNDVYCFRFGPKYPNSTKQLLSKFELDAYSQSIPYDNLELEFIVFSPNPTENYGFTPSSLESTLLTNYFLQNNDLPPANNEL